MEKKIRYSVDERIFRNKQGQLTHGYITRLVSNKKVEGDEVITALSKATGLSEPKCMFVLSELQQLLLRKAYDGRGVVIPKLGTFRLALRSHSVPIRKDAGPKSIDSISLNYLPAVEIKKALDLANLQFKEY